MLRNNQKWLIRIFILLDVFVIYISLVLTFFIRFRSNIVFVADSSIPLWFYINAFIFISPLYIIIYAILKLYEPFRRKTLAEEAGGVILANFLGILFFVLGLYLFKEMNYSRIFLLVFAFVNTFISLWTRFTIRYVLRRAREKGYNQKNIVLIGNSALANDVLDRIFNNPHWGYNVIGMVDDKKQIKHFKGKAIQCLGLIDNLKEILTDKEIDGVIVTLDVANYHKLEKIINVCEKAGIRTELVPDYYRFIPSRPFVDELDGIPLINTRYVPLDNMSNMVMKRTFDIIVSLIGLILCSPILLIIAISIKLTSKGSILFKQERIGYNRKPFDMFKFRSMIVQETRNSDTKWTTSNDSRKTRIGSFIRKTSIDELPQLFNVLKGDMSLIGPRPERGHFVKKFKEEIPKYMIKHHVRPGITGWAQVNGLRGDTSIEKRIQYDLYYIENWNLWLDVKIVFMTLLNGFVNRNAY